MNQSFRLMMEHIIQRIKGIFDIKIKSDHRNIVCNINDCLLAAAYALKQW